MANQPNNTTAPVVTGNKTAFTKSNDGVVTVFMTMSDFKEITLGNPNAVLNVIKNPHTGKFFVAAGHKNYKIQTSLIVERSIGVFELVIPSGKELKFLYTDGDTDNGCIVAATTSNNIVATL